jgi:NADH dehydrogenase
VDLTILVTGASGFIGGAISDRLIGRAEVRSLTSHPGKNRFGERVQSFAYDFDAPMRMEEAFRGVDVFVNSYYVRFNYGRATFELAVDRTRELIALARLAGVRTVVHVSVSNADERSDLPYYRNKGRIERLVRESGLDYTILQPAIVVGPGDILVNNIAFFLRRLPIFTIFGRGDYRVQPITLDAFADIAVEAIDGAHGSATLPVAGPSDWVFLDLVRAVHAAVGSRARIVHAPPALALAGLKVAGLFLGDVVLTSDEVKGLTREYLYVERPLRRGADFAEWLAQPGVASTLGRRYESELARHFRS